MTRWRNHATALAAWVAVSSGCAGGGTQEAQRALNTLRDRLDRIEQATTETRSIAESIVANPDDLEGNAVRATVIVENADAVLDDSAGAKQQVNTADEALTRTTNLYDSFIDRFGRWSVQIVGGLAGLGVIAVILWYSGPLKKVLSWIPSRKDDEARLIAKGDNRGAIAIRRHRDPVLNEKTRRLERKG